MDLGMRASGAGSASTWMEVRARVEGSISGVAVNTTPVSSFRPVLSSRRMAQTVADSPR